jgi:vacuolar-type H+-ATPase subunit E/Vma4
MEPETGPGALIGAIDERAAEERARLIAEAESRAKEILRAAREESEQLRSEAMAGLERELAAEQQRLLGEARMRARAEGLAKRRQLLEEAFTSAAGEIARLKAGPGAAAAMEALAEEARTAVGDPCTVDLSAEEGRVVATSADGRRSVENSLQGRLRRVQGSAEHLVAERLFGSARGSNT